MIRVRIAPSPTGHLHIGTAQSALYNWLFARKNNGQFLLRIEDTDKERSKKEYADGILEVLLWLGLKPDEEPVIQSHNLPRHKEMLEKLIKEGKAFYCRHTKEELESERKDQEDKKQPPRHVCSYKNSPENNNGEGIIRLAVNENSDRIISFEDQIRGKVEFREALLGDFSIARSINDPLYHFAVAVDDADMKITHVIRGEDHISNTPKHILIFEALGFPIPTFAHLPLILAADRSKLSKRHGDTSALAYKKDYLPESMINFLGALGYTFSKELISKEEMLQEFELEKVHKSGAVFDIKKLNWINSQYIKNLPPEDFKRIAGIPELKDEAIALITERLEKLTDISNFDYFWKEPEYDKELLKWKKATLEKSIETLAEVQKIIEAFSAIGGPASGWDKGKDELRKIMDEFSAKAGDRGLVYWPFRVALTGREKSPDPIDIAFVLSKEIILKRLKNALKKLE